MTALDELKRLRESATKPGDAFLMSVNHLDDVIALVEAAQKVAETIQLMKTSQGPSSILASIVGGFFVFAEDAELAKALEPFLKTRGEGG